jgi:hypothetical protein
MAHARWVFGPDAGYRWEGHLRSVKAAWIVPALPDGSHIGQASTWIGAQQATGPDAFVQVGTVENKETAGVSGETYAAFWSDTALHFHATYLFPVTPLTEVTASLTASRGEWTVSIRDVDSGQSAHFASGEPSTAAPHFAEWLQEDATISSGRTQHAYPDIRKVDFSRVTVNTAAPNDGNLNALWVTDAGTILGPDPLVSGSFNVAPVHIGSIGEHYLEIFAGVLTPFQSFTKTLQALPYNKVGAQAVAEAEAFRAAEARYLRELTGFAWPAAAENAMKALVATNRLLLGTVRAFPSLGRSLAQWQRLFVARLKATGRASELVDRTLRVAQPSTLQE